MVSGMPMRLLQSDDWIAAVCNSGNTGSVREIMVRCAETMLPYWEARFDKDESMSQLITAMRQFSVNPISETRSILKSDDSIEPFSPKVGFVPTARSLPR